MQLSVYLRLWGYQESVIFPGIAADNRCTRIATQRVGSYDLLIQRVIKVDELSLIEVYIAHLNKSLRFYKNTLILRKEKYLT